MSKLTTIPGTGLNVMTASALAFTVVGPVTYSSEYDIFYCAGQSWPSDIVQSVIQPEIHTGADYEKSGEINKMLAAATEYREIKRQIAELETEADVLKKIMVDEMDAKRVEKLQAGPFEIRYTLVESIRLDTASFKKEQPDLYSAYSKSTVSTRFQVA